MLNHSINLKYKENIPYLESNIIPSFSNAWLSGFIDAEGCFSARVKHCRTSKLGKNLLVDFTIAQKKDILILIRNLLDVVKDTNIRFDPSWQGYQFYLSNKKLLIRLISYLKVYRLKSKKNIDFVIFTKIHTLGINKNHLTEKG